MYRCGVRLCIYLSVTCLANEFYEEYEVFSADSSSQQVFGYSEQFGCIVERDNDELFVQIQKIGTFQRSARLKIFSGPEVRNMRVDACFENDERSNLLVRDIRRNLTILMSPEKLDYIDLTYQLLRYDHIYGLVHLTSNGKISSHRIHDVIERNGTHSSSVIARPFINQYDDFIVVESTIFILVKRGLYKLRMDGALTFIIGIDTDILWFQLYPRRRKLLHISEQLPHVFLYALQLGALAFFVYCLKYKLIIKGHRHVYELVPPPIVKQTV